MANQCEAGMASALEKGDSRERVHQALIKIVGEAVIDASDGDSDRRHFSAEPLIEPLRTVKAADRTADAYDRPAFFGGLMQHNRDKPTRGIERHPAHAMIRLARAIAGDPHPELVIAI